jgi:hypothetical protein
MKQELLLRVQLLLASTSSLQQLLLQLVQLELAQAQNESWFSLSSWTTPLAFRQSQDRPHGASSVP